jgi:CHAT domain-containing protein
MTRRRAEPTRDFFGIAPVFDGRTELNSSARRFLSFNRQDTTQTENPISYLPGTRREVDEILNLFSTAAGPLGRYLYDDSRVLLGAKATERALLLSELEEYRYVHFATHGFANEGDARLSGLLFLSDSDGDQAVADTADDGILHAGETYALRLKADLVVLSACETGLGPEADGEGIMGLSHGFLAAGATNLIVSLWPSDDAGTRHLMVEFYRRLLQGLPIRDALRMAKLDLIAMGDIIAKPYFWSPFIHIGA